MPCPKCDLGCAGAQALEMHESVCCGPLVEAAPLSAEQAAQLEAPALRNGGQVESQSVVAPPLPVREDPLRMLATQAAVARDLPVAPTTPSMITLHGYVCVGELRAPIPPGPLTTGVACILSTSGLSCGVVPPALPSGFSGCADRDGSVARHVILFPDLFYLDQGLIL